MCVRCFVPSANILQSQFDDDDYDGVHLHWCWEKLECNNRNGIIRKNRNTLWDTTEKETNEWNTHRMKMRLQREMRAEKVTAASERTNKRKLVESNLAYAGLPKPICILAGRSFRLCDWRRRQQPTDRRCRRCFCLHGIFFRAGLSVGFFFDTHTHTHKSTFIWLTN